MSDANAKKEYGSPDKPLMLRATSLGQPASDRAYSSVVTEDGRHFFFGMTRGMVGLHSMQATTAYVGWPDKPSSDPVEPPAA